ncbi:hypothetical protein ONZ45_g4149 [Pleurotus djamor]|nr:hypothetical protein ONZ45_g4149 [Pleurotus djamor]
MSFNIPIQLVLGGWFVFAVSHLVARARKRSLLPPGPPSDPIIGNLRSMPTENIHIQFHEWAKKYGDVMHLTLPGQHLVVLDSDKSALDLLEKRSSLYSDRPPIVVYPLMGWEKILAFMRYGDEWRYHRKLIHSHLTVTASRAYQPIQLKNAYILAKDLLKNDGNFNQLLGRFSTAIIIEVAYGHQVQTENDKYLQLASEAGDALSAGGPPGGSAVDLLPILQYFPSWFPGTHYANVARHFKGTVDQLFQIPFQETLEAIKAGNATESFLSRCIAELGELLLSDSDKDALRGAAAQLYAAGAETTWSTLATFMLAMILHPECQRLGQEEVDRVVGRDRLPSFQDLKSLPYINAIVEETLRSQGGNDEPGFSAAFGYGRRICPGRHLANSSLFIAVATILSTLNLSKVKGPNGNEITPEVEYVTGITSKVILLTFTTYGTVDLYPFASEDGITARFCGQRLCWMDRLLPDTYPNVQRYLSELNEYLNLQRSSNKLNWSCYNNADTERVIVIMRAALLILLAIFLGLVVAIPAQDDHNFGAVTDSIDNTDSLDALSGFSLNADANDEIEHAWQDEMNSKELVILVRRRPAIRAGIRHYVRRAVRQAIRRHVRRIVRQVVRREIRRAVRRVIRGIGPNGRGVFPVPLPVPVPVPVPVPTSQPSTGDENPGTDVGTDPTPPPTDTANNPNDPAPTDPAGGSSDAPSIDPTPATSA